MESPEIPKVLTVNEEERKRYGSSQLGDACVLARNPIRAEAGTHFIMISQPGWICMQTSTTRRASANWLMNLTQPCQSLTDLENIKAKDGRTLLENVYLLHG